MASIKRISQIGMVAVMFGMMGACASSNIPKPTDTVAKAQTSVSQAEQVGARDYAPLELREAKKKIDEAKKIMSKEKYEDAKRMAEKAMVDAELAEIKALSGKAQNAVKQLKESIKTLQEEIERNQNKN